MKTKKQTKIIHEGEYMAETEVDITYNDDPWSPYLSILVISRCEAKSNQILSNTTPY